MKVGLTDFELQEIFSPIEVLVGNFDEMTRQIYYETYRYQSAYILKSAIKILIRRIKTRKPPLLSEIDEAISEASAEYQEQQEQVLCERCDNTGFFLDGDIAYTCRCIHGKRKEAIWKLNTYDEKKINRYLRDNPPDPPVKGIWEYNQKMKIFELSLPEHERWIERERKKLEELRARAKAAENRQIKKTVEQILEDVEELKAIREKENEADDIPF
jgi:hypothetical protein